MRRSYFPGMQLRAVAYEVQGANRRRARCA